MQNSLETRDGFAEMLQELFRFANVSNKEVAKLMAVHERTVNNWVNGYSEPSPSELIKMFRLLNVPMIPFIRSNNSFVDADADRKAIIDYVNNYASNEELRDMRFNLTVKHGSSVKCQLALVSMLNHMKLRYRLLVAKNTLMAWDLAKVEDGLQHMENSSPNVDIVLEATVKAHHALKAGKNSYTDI